MVSLKGRLDSCTLVRHVFLHEPEPIQAQTAVSDSRPDETTALSKWAAWTPDPGLSFRFTKTKKTSCGVVHVVHLQDFWPSVQVLRWFHTLRVCHLFSRVYLFSYGSWWNPPYPSLKKKKKASTQFTFHPLTVWTHNSWFLQPEVFP